MNLPKYSEIRAICICIFYFALLCFSFAQCEMCVLHFDLLAKYHFFFILKVNIYDDGDLFRFADVLDR